MNGQTILKADAALVGAAGFGQPQLQRQLFWSDRSIDLLSAEGAPQPQRQGEEDAAAKPRMLVQISWQAGVSDGERGIKMSDHGLPSLDRVVDLVDRAAVRCRW